MPTSSEASRNPGAARAHRSFLLRCWHEQDGEQSGARIWRFSVREVSDEPAEVLLSSPGELVDFLIESLARNTKRK
jgi:hypothetical protein